MEGAFKGTAKSLGELYTYYARVGQTYPTLGKYVKYAIQRIGRQTHNYAASSKYVHQLSAAELMKEQRLLSEVFGVNLNLKGYSSKEDYKQIIDTLNNCLNLKKVYDRNIQLIKNTKGMKAVFSHYPTYFMHAFEAHWHEIKEKFNSQFPQHGVDAGVILKNILQQEFPVICEEGIRRMLDGPELETLKIDPSLRDAYKELLNFVGKIGQQGSIAQQIYQAYELDKIKEALIEEITGKNAWFNDPKKAFEITKGKIKENYHPRGGYSLEAIETAILSAVVSKIPNARGTVHHTGQLGAKADNILMFNIDTSLLEEAFEKAGRNRAEHITAFSRLGEKLKNLDDGFIVYSSDKNYSLNSSFYGYSVGKKANASVFINNLYQGSAQGNTLLGVINQLGAGAMAEGLNDGYELLLAQEVAFMLFDDYTTIGQADMSGRAIHMMNLNGIMVPLSAILSFLGDAIDSLDSNEIRKIVNVKITAPQILFKRNEDQFDWMEVNHATALDAWNAQRAHALENTKIEAHILRNFRQIVSNYL